MRRARASSGSGLSVGIRLKASTSAWRAGPRVVRNHQVRRAIRRAGCPVGGQGPGRRPAPNYGWRGRPGYVRAAATIRLRRSTFRCYGPTRSPLPSGRGPARDAAAAASACPRAPSNRVTYTVKPAARTVCTSSVARAMLAPITAGSSDPIDASASTVARSAVPHSAHTSNPCRWAWSIRPEAAAAAWSNRWA